MKVLVIIPCYNEEKNIVKTVKSLKKYNYDYIVINDGSTDNSKRVLEENNLNYLDLSNNLGIGAAVQTGYRYALRNNYDIAVQFDGDGQHDANYIKTIIDPIINEEVDLVVGSRFITKEDNFLSTRMRRVGINTISFLLTLFTGKRIKDMTSGFRASNRKVIEYFSRVYPVEYPEPVTNLKLVKKKYKIVEVPVKMKEREFGKSSISSLKSIYYMINVILYFFVINFFKGGE